MNHKSSRSKLLIRQGTKLNRRGFNLSSTHYHRVQTKVLNPSSWYLVVVVETYSDVVTTPMN